MCLILAAISISRNLQEVGYFWEIHFVSYNLLVLYFLGQSWVIGNNKNSKKVLVSWPRKVTKKKRKHQKYGIFSRPPPPIFKRSMCPLETTGPFSVWDGFGFVTDLSFDIHCSIERIGK